MSSPRTDRLAGGSAVRSLTAELVDEVQGALEKRSTEALPSVRNFLLDYVGVAARGSRTRSATIHRQVSETLTSAQPSGAVVIGTTERRAPIAAAMCNAVAGHSIEYDDVHNEASLHPGVVVYPTALATAAMRPLDDATFIRSVIAGYEVMCRVGAAAYPPAQYQRNFHPTGTAGAAGAAATAAVGLGLTAQELVAAIGIAGTMAAGGMAFLDDGAWTKHLNPANAARVGMEAASLAAAGFVAPLDGIGGRHGYLSAFSEDPRPDVLRRRPDPGALAITETSVKAHTCCRYNQGAIDAVLAICRENRLDATDVAHITVGIPSVAVDIVAEPHEVKEHPVSVVDAQFSLQFGIAAAVLFGRAGLDEYTEEVLSRADVHDLASRVSYRTDPRIDAAYPRRWHASAVVETVNARRYESWVDDPKGDPENPLTAQELEAKFRNLTDGIYSTQRQERVIRLISELGESETQQLLAESLESDVASVPETRQGVSGSVETVHR